MRRWFVGLAVVVCCVQPVAAEPSPESRAGSPGPGAASGTSPEVSGAAAGSSPSNSDASSQVIPENPQEVVPPGFVVGARRALRQREKPVGRALGDALGELERQLDRYRSGADGFASTMSALVKRQYLEQRTIQDQRFAVQIRREEAEQTKARDATIALLEGFVRTHPNDARYTADAMFRLGELYFERSQLQFQAQSQGDPKSKSGAELSRDTPDYSPTITVYRRLAELFPSYERLDGVYYLIGFCYNEMSESDKAVMAWLNLICSNRYPFDPLQFDRNATEAAVESSQVNQHPSLDLGEKNRSAAPSGDVDPYFGCQPVVPQAKFSSETWFRIGEYHFDDYRDAQSIPKSISAYRRMLQDPEDRNFNLALYKVAWAYYRSSRYAEAIKHFGMLVQWSDEQQKRTGQVGSELRPEAIQYLGISFAYDDWNDNQVPDPQEGGKSGIERLQDSTLLPQDQPWTAEVYLQSGDVYFDEAKYGDAIAVWKLALEKWPGYRKAPETIDKIAQAYSRNNELETATAWRAKLNDYGEGSAWWKANVDYPKEQRQAEVLAESGVMQSAIYHHQQAQQLRRQCVAEKDPDLCTRAQTQYATAALSYRSYLQRYPNSPQAYELHYNLADALYWSEDYVAAANEYSLVRDSNLDNRFLPESARRVVEARRRIVELAEQKGEIVVRQEPPQPSGVPRQMTPLPMPQLLQDLAQARETYIARVPESDDREGVLEAYDYNDALLLYLYGYWYNAKKRFERIFAERCSGATADEAGRVAWVNLRNMAVARNDTDEVERVGRLLSERQCTFSSKQGAPKSVDCSNPANKDEPQCVAGADLVNVRYKRAIEVFQSAERGSGEEQQRLYEQASEMLVQAVNEEPKHQDAPLALERAAIAMERINRFESAASLYQRIVDEVGPRASVDAEEQKRLDAILANAYFRLAFNANRFFDFERAITNYAVVANAKRFSSSADPQILQKREDALINAALALEWLQRYDQAAEYFKRAAETSRDPKVQRQARFRLAEMSFKRREWGAAVRSMQDFIRTYQKDKDAGELVVLAYWRVAQAQQASNPRGSHSASLQDVVAAFARTGQPPGSMAAEYAADAAFLLADAGSDAFENFAIDPKKPATLQSYVADVTKQIEEGSRRAKQFSESYASIPKYRRPTWTIAAFVRQGRVYEVLARAVLNTPFVIPADMQKQLRQLAVEQREDIRLQVEDRLRATLDEKVRPIECRAVARYALAARAARAGSLDTEYAQNAVDRLQAYGDERIAGCLEEARKEDQGFELYQSGEFARAPRGRSLELSEGLAPPPVSELELSP